MLIEQENIEKLSTKFFYEGEQAAGVMPWVLAANEAVKIWCGDCLELMKAMPDNSVDMVMTSPPYEKARTYGIDYSFSGQEWVDWCMPRYLECVRVCRGLVVWIVEGQTKKFQWSATPALLMADLHRAGVKLRKPPAYKRNGIFGSGGPEWLRNDYEFAICSSKGRLPWSDNTAKGRPPVCKPGGNPSHRMANGDRVKSKPYKPPALANPGNVIDCGAVGGGNIGHPLAHDNEAPFPEKLVEFFTLSFCKPEGIILDPFFGSGTTGAVAERFGRKCIGIDCRASQAELSARRIEASRTWKK